MKIIIANWKMNHDFDEIDEWLDGLYKIYANNFSELQNYLLIVCPSAIFLDYIDSELIEDGLKYLEIVAERDGRQVEDFDSGEVNEHVLEGRPFRLGAQDCHFEESGSYTGELSAKMLRNVGCEYVILGHSERRNYNHETDELVQKKVRAAVDAGLKPIVCVGEDANFRNEARYFEFIKKQILGSIPRDIKISHLIIAYEPIWSIGTGETASVGQINEIINFIRRLFDREMAGVVGVLQLLYGGSVNPSNSAAILEIEQIDGLLIGKASLDVENFLSLCPSLNVKRSNSEPSAIDKTKQLQSSNSQDNAKNDEQVNDQESSNEQLAKEARSILASDHNSSGTTYH